MQRHVSRVVIASMMEFHGEIKTAFIQSYQWAMVSHGMKYRTKKKCSQNRMSFMQLIADACEVKQLISAMKMTVT